MYGMAMSTVMSLFITVLFMLALRPLAFNINLIDVPDHRKPHVGLVPIIGGIAMFIGIVIGCMLTERMVPEDTYLLIGGGLLVAIGALDDRYDLSPYVRLIAQALAALLMAVGAGVVVKDIGNPLFFGVIHLGPADVLFTVLVAVSVINAFNMLDGLDGIAGGVALTSLALLAIVAAGAGRHPELAIILVMLAAVAGFLIFNVPALFNRPVRSFMGDAGSTLIGFALTWLCIDLGQGQGRAMAPVTGLWLVAIPLFELFSSFVRRLAKGRSPLGADTDHTHHILLRAGFSVREIFGIVMVFSALFGAIGIAGYSAGVPDGVMFFALVVLGLGHYWVIRHAWVVARWLRRTAKDESGNRSVSN